MNRLLSFLCIIFAAFLISCTASKKNVAFVTNHPNSLQKTYKTLLIVGEGDVASRYDIENMATAIRTKLEKANIQCHYEFLGNPLKVNIEENLKKMVVDNKYDAFLRISPQDAHLKQVNRLPTGPYFTGTPAGNSVMHFDDGRVNRLILEYWLELTEIPGQVVWAGTLTTNTIGMPTSALHATVSEKVVAALKENKLLPAAVGKN
jgi:hypothetical protein